MFPVLDRDSPEGVRSGTTGAWTHALWVSFFFCRSGDSDSVKRFLSDGNGARDGQADANILNAVQIRSHLAYDAAAAPWVNEVTYWIFWQIDANSTVAEFSEEDNTVYSRRVLLIDDCE